MGYLAMLEKVHKNGETGGRKSKDEQEKVNKEFVKTYPRGCHKRKSISTTDDASPPPSPPPAPTPAPTDAPMPPKAKMPKKEDTIKAFYQTCVSSV